MPRFETKQLGVLEERRAKATAAGTATASCKACRFSMGDRQFLEGSMMRIHKNPLGVGGALFSILFVQAMLRRISRCNTVLNQSLLDKSTWHLPG